jgi:hypothetical protein
MPKRKELRGVAAGLLGAFVSRNNDVGGYWALGKLYAHALKADAPSVCVDVLRGILTPASDEFREMAADFRRALTFQLATRKLPSEWVKATTICVEFTRARHPHGPGEIFNCTVAITDDRDRTHCARAVGTCWAHDPFRERGSTRYFKPSGDSDYSRSALKLAATRRKRGRSERLIKTQWLLIQGDREDRPDEN